jgi:4-hydroxy-tetrahydrodipicolinate reductase
MTLKIGVCGGNGRMGQEMIAAISAGRQKYVLTGTLTRGSNDQDIKRLCEVSDVIIDFSTPDALSSLLKIAGASKTNVIIGTTGLDGKHFEMINKAGDDIAVLYAPNTSLGANLVALLSAKSAKILPNNYDIEIVEAHHRHKQDAPSGAAIMIGREIAASMGSNFEEKANFGRHLKGKRKDGEIGFSSVRAGGIFGEHTVIIASEHEVIRIQHQALGRAVFAEGALVAADWIARKAPGVYSMKDVLGL